MWKSLIVLYRIQRYSTPIVVSWGLQLEKFLPTIYYFYSLDGSRMKENKNQSHEGIVSRRPVNTHRS